jgi:hypothetical protein
MSNNYLKPLFSPSMYGSGVRIVNTSIFHLDETDVLTAHRYLSVKGKLSPLVWSPSLMPGGRPFIVPLSGRPPSCQEVDHSRGLALTL